MLLDWLMDRVPYLERFPCNWTAVYSFYVCKYFSKWVFNLFPLYIQVLHLIYFLACFIIQMNPLICCPQWDNRWYFWHWITQWHICLDLGDIEQNTEIAAGGELFNLGLWPLHMGMENNRKGARQVMNVFIFFIFEKLTQKFDFSHQRHTTGTQTIYQ